MSAFFFDSSADTDLVRASSDSGFSVFVQIESGRGGAGISGTGSGATVVIPRKGVGGGIICTFFGGNGGVTDI